MFTQSPRAHRVLAASRRLVLFDTVPPRHLPLPGHIESAVSGDVVLVEAPDDPARARVVGVEPRRSALVRARMDGDDDTGSQVIAANVDVVAACIPLDRAPRPRLVERAVAWAYASNARPLVILTKRDAALAEDTAAYVAVPDVDVVIVSAFDADDVETLASLIAPGECVVLVGPSGAGKSTLTNALRANAGGADDDVQLTGDVQDDGRGRHTTTTARLLPLPWGAFLVDTPGIRTLGLIADDDDVDAVFPEMEALAGGCRFPDCAHDSEPGCAVTAAVASGTLEAARLSSWRALRAEVERRRAREDPVAIAAQKSRVKSMERALRARLRDKGR